MAIFGLKNVFFLIFFWKWKNWKSNTIPEYFKRLADHRAYYCEIFEPKIAKNSRFWPKKPVFWWRFHADLYWAPIMLQRDSPWSCAQLEPLPRQGIKNCFLLHHTGLSSADGLNDFLIDNSTTLPFVDITQNVSIYSKLVSNTLTKEILWWQCFASG